MLIEEIVDHGLGLAPQSVVADVRIGLGYTAVCLEDGRCGLAFTLHEKEYESCCVIPEAGSLAGRKGSELIPWMNSQDVTACAVGLATLNAVIAAPAAAVESDILDLLPVDPEDSVGMIGYFGPLVSPIKKRAHAFHVFERKADPEYDILPESAAASILPDCRVVVVTATTLLNHTIDGILELCRSAREIAILGPSTPFLPEIFRPHGVTILSGIQVVDPAQVLRTVSEGGGARQFGKAVRKLTLRCC
ncbi:MAG TPA: DUF364 domain-containing protein [Acidobacteriota bacterium]|nr:DUF364 domain-containing protein [Acidobacteriota bacterium]